MSHDPLYSAYADDADMRELIEEFAVGLEETCDRLRAAIDAGQTVDARRIGHQMKGAGAGYGYPELTDVGAALEQAVDIAGGIDQSVRENADRFVSVCERVRLGAGCCSR